MEINCKEEFLKKLKEYYKTKRMKFLEEKKDNNLIFNKEKHNFSSKSNNYLINYLDRYFLNTTNNNNNNNNDDDDDDKVKDYSIHEVREEAKKEAISFSINEIITNYNCSEDVLREFIPYFLITTWFHIAQKYNLSEQFIEEFRNRLGWGSIVQNQTLSEELINSYKSEFNNKIWEELSKFQSLSEEFIMNHKDYVSWMNILLFQENISSSFIEMNKWRLSEEKEEKKKWDLERNMNGIILESSLTSNHSQSTIHQSQLFSNQSNKLQPMEQPSGILYYLDDPPWFDLSEDQTKKKRSLKEKIYNFIKKIRSYIWK